MEIKTITPERLDSLRTSGQPVELVDVRTPAEFREVHVEFARNVPLNVLNVSDFAERKSGNGLQPLYVICQSGSRGRQACEMLTKAVQREIINVEGGTSAWAKAGLPVIRGKKSISLERQVRIAAGSLVLIGCLLGFFVHPWLISLAAFVGAGLVFAGVTDTCGMAMLLARMPWNQVRE